MDCPNRAESWTVDLETKLASRDSDILKFREIDGQMLAVTFVGGGNCSLEERCLIAGEAAAAIKTALMRSSTAD